MGREHTVSAVGFTGWPVEAIEFYEGLEDDNSRTYWQAHKAVYDQSVKRPMEELLSELEAEFGPGKLFRPYRDVRFSNDKTPYKLSCAAHLAGGYVSVSADELFVGSGLHMPMADDLKRYRAAVDADRSGRELERIVAALRKAKYDVGAHESVKTAPRGYAKDHPRIELLKLKGIVMSKAWAVGGWLGTRKAKDRVVATLVAARPLNAWIADHVRAPGA
jgi:uncharacterized protein (TIGR02453 family)